MIEELKEEKLIEKVGGRFRLSALIQKRLVFLNKGAHSFVSTADKKDKLQIVIQEILEDKIYLNMDGEVVENIPVDENADAVPTFDDFGNAAF